MGQWLFHGAGRGIFNTPLETGLRSVVSKRCCEGIFRRDHVLEPTPKQVKLRVEGNVCSQAAARCWPLGLT